MPFYRVEVTSPFGDRYEKVVEADNIGQARVKALQGTESGSKTGLPVEIQGETRRVPYSRGGVREEVIPAVDPTKSTYVPTYERPEEFKDVRFRGTDTLFDGPSFSEFINPDINLDLVDPPIISADPTVAEADTRDLSGQRVRERKALENRLAKIEEQRETAEKAAGTEAPTEFQQTGSTRSEMLERVSPFAVFLEEMANRGLSGTQGIARDFLTDQYDPLRDAYQASQLLPMMMSGRSTMPFNTLSGPQAQGGVYLSGAQQNDLRDALTRQQTGDYGTDNPEEIALLKADDQAIIDASVPSFASYLQTSFPGGGRSAGLRIGEQLRELANLNISDASTPLAKFYLNPANAEQAGLIYNLAQRANQARFSPMIQNAVAAALPSGFSAFADFARESVPAVGESLGDAPIPNFAQFLSQRGFF
mgnify:CR=1 FL=1